VVGIVAVIIIMVVVNLLMIFAIVKSAGQLEGTIKKYFLEHLGDEGVRLEKTGKEDILDAAEPKMATPITPASDAAAPEKEKEDEFSADVAAMVALQAMHLDASQYKNASFKEDYRAMRRMDLLNKDAALSNVIEAQEPAGDKSAIYAQIADILSYDTAFRMSSLDPDTQDEILNESLTEEQKEVYDEYRESHGGYFDILDFYGFISEKAQMDEDVYYVYKAPGAEDPVATGRNVRTIEDESITEGMKIVYKNKLYDYSV